MCDLAVVKSERCSPLNVLIVSLGYYCASADCAEAEIKMFMGRLLEAQQEMCVCAQLSEKNSETGAAQAHGSRGRRLRTRLAVDEHVFLPYSHSCRDCDTLQAICSPGTCREQSHCDAGKP